MRISSRAIVLGLTLMAAPLEGSIVYDLTVQSSVSSTGSYRYDSVTGLSESIGTCFLNAQLATGPCASITANPSSNVLGLTSATASISGFSYDPQNGVSGTADSSISANLATGIVGILSDGPQCVPATPLCADNGSGRADLQDSVTFTNNTGHTVDIPISWMFDGTLVSNETPGNSPTYTIASGICFASTEASDPLAQCGALNPTDVIPGSFNFLDQSGSVTNTLPTAGWASSTIVPGANSNSETFQGTFAIPSGVSEYDLSAYLQVSCTVADCDFSHTGQLTIDSLPSGVSFTSGSGVLLTGSAPEPSSWLMGLFVVFAIPVSSRFRRRLRNVGRFR